MQQYLDELRYILKHGQDRPNRTGVPARAIFDRALRFNLSRGFPAVTTKLLHMESVTAELLWFLSGSTDVHDLQALGCHIWDANAFAPTWLPHARFDGDVGFHYGKLWTAWPAEQGKTINQMEQVIRGIQSDPSDPSSRRLIVTAWNPASVGQDKVCLPPCHILLQFFVDVDRRRLYLKVYMRSTDMFLGAPFNVASYACLLSMIAQVTNLKPAVLTIDMGDAHIYRNHFEQVRRQLRRRPLPLPKLWLNPRVKDIFTFKMEDIRLDGYRQHPAIKAPMAV